MAADEQVLRLLEEGVATRTFPGAAVAIGVGGETRMLRGVGRFTYAPEAAAVTERSAYDLASLTKVVATTTAVMLLEEAGKLDLEAPVSRFMPEFSSLGKTKVTISHCLSHTSGLPAFREYEREGIRTRQGIIDAIMAEPLYSAPGRRFVYSDFGPIVLAVLIERLTAVPWARWCAEHIFEPLGMADTGFRATPPFVRRGEGDPDPSDPAVVPTEQDDVFRFRLVQGEVHDERAWCLGGAAGHAGLFGSAADLCRFASMLANEGELPGSSRRFLRAETIRKYTAAVAPEQHSRALGWDTKSAAGYSSAGEAEDGFGPRSFGHTGFTGTCMWVDPDARLWYVLLTNRVHPSRVSSSSLRRSVGPKGGEQAGIAAVRSLLADMAARTGRL